MPPILQFLCDRRSADAFLTRSGGFDFPKDAPGAFSLVRHLVEKSAPRRVVHRLDERPGRQSLDIQPLDENCTILVNDAPTRLVLKVTPPISNVRMNPLQRHKRLAPIRAALLAARHCALRPAELGLGALEMTGIRNLGSIRQHSVGRQSNVYADGVRLGRKRFGFTFHAERDEPFVRLSNQRHGLDRARNGAMQFDLDFARSLNPQLAVVRQTAAAP